MGPASHKITKDNKFLFLSTKLGEGKKCDLLYSNELLKHILVVLELSC